MALQVFRDDGWESTKSFAHLVRPDGRIDKVGDKWGSWDTVTQLNSLGGDGWQIVGTEVLEYTNSVMRTFWLQRALD